MKKLLIGLWLCSGLLLAEDHALVVGCCGEYKDRDSNVPILQGTQNDAQHMLDILLDRGVKRSNIDYLIEHNATRNNIVKKLKAKNTLKKGDRLYVYYSGHGTSVGDRSAFGKRVQSDRDVLRRLENSAGFVPYDFNLQDIKNTLLITSRDFKPTFKLLDARGVNIVLMVDACYAGNGFRSSGLTGVKSSPIDPKLLAQAMSANEQFVTSHSEYKHLTFYGATLTNIVTQEIEYNGQVRGEFSVEIERCLKKQYKSDTITNKNLKECLQKNFSPFVFSSAIYPTDSRLDSKFIIRASLKKPKTKEQPQSFQEKLFALQGTESPLKMGIFSIYNRELVINRFCLGERLKIEIKNKSQKESVIAFTMDRKGRVIMLKPDRNSRLDFSSNRVVETEVIPPFGKDRVKIFTTNDVELFRTIFNYRNRKNGILSGGDIETIYNALVQSKKFKTAHIEVETISTDIKECKKGERQ